mgnify:CR=1 FL=1
MPSAPCPGGGAALGPHTSFRLWHAPCARPNNPSSPAPGLLTSFGACFVPYGIDQDHPPALSLQPSLQPSPQPCRALTRAEGRHGVLAHHQRALLPQLGAPGHRVRPKHGCQHLERPRGREGVWSGGVGADTGRLVYRATPKGLGTYWKHCVGTVCGNRHTVMAGRALV